jgi:thioredoxin 1
MLIENYIDSEITHDKFNEIVNNSHNVVVVNFFAEWCMNCLMFTPVIDDLATQFQEVLFLKINVDDNKNLAEKFNVSKTPCVIIFKKGFEVERIKGAQPQDFVEEKIKSCLK